MPSSGLPDGELRALLVAGKPGTGKSTLANALLERLGDAWAFLDVDTLYVPFISCILQREKLTLAEAYGSDLLRTMRSAQYDGLLDQARQMLQHRNKRVVLIGSFSTELAQPSCADLLARRLGSAPQILETWAPRDVVRERLAARCAFWDAMRLHHWDREQLGYSDVPPARTWPVINTMQPYDIGRILAAALSPASVSTVALR